MRRTLAATILPLTAVLLPFAGACGYSSTRLVDVAGARTIAVMPFENRTFRRDLELRLTQAVAEEVRARTSFALVTEGRADLVLRGSMNAAEQVVIQRGDRTVALKRLFGDVDVRLHDGRTGAVLREYRVHAIEEYTPGTSGESLEGSATDEWTRRTAERIVQGLERGF